ncbi:hypothetical protein IZ6_22010 [Terrihabitans soli]|uniref:histidine kinase n=1 Tax=Terrihabitans soli TaxID=708113 RepID=A0A6S6QPR4_9HYPH|nr:HWE histidine kinase domain-containing protein [Terrihabitans soli]BCJ91466.1 hypothetical protein IZ6_22010 [Terrihabitans soli]
MTERDITSGDLSRREQLRVINNRALVSAIADHCLQHTKDTEAARGAIAARVAALTKANANALLNGGEQVGVADMARGAIAAFDFPAERFSLRGAKVDIGANGALTFALILNELGMNATRYGALSNASGRIRIEWFVERVARDFTLTWIEEGGPPVTGPGKTGFGCRLIGHAFAEPLGGTAQFEFNRDGLVCVLNISLDRLIED